MPRNVSYPGIISMYGRFWWTEIARGVLALTLGMIYLSLHTIIYLLIYILGAYLLTDGLIDLYRIIANEQTLQRHLPVYLSAATSISLGVLSLLDPKVTLLIVSIIFAVRIVIRGIQVFGETRRSQGRLAGLRWLYGSALVLLGLICLLPVMLQLITAFLILFLGLYALGDGLYMLGRGVRLAIAPARTMATDPPQQVSRNLLDIPAHLPPTTRRALIFVRRSGASGLGHIGWAFEWDNGWFNVGSVENHKNRAFAPAEQADFWTAHTTNPVETMRKMGSAYDEYKVFYITKPHANEAWHIVIWISRLPYMVVRRNCVDATYDILRSYGLTNLPDPVTEYAPNDWYDSLSGRGYAVTVYSAIPLRLQRSATRPLATQEIALTIPKNIPGRIPPWRTTGSSLRGLLEISLTWQKMMQDVRLLFTMLRKAMVKR